jgi:peptide-methionine (R)-S-oxide reductase
MDWKNKPKSFWKDKLKPNEYAVTQESGTERAFSGEYWDKKDAGLYQCVCCGTPLFESTEKYDSGCGWPSFYAPKRGEAGAGDDIEYIADHSHGMNRIEVRCKTCGAHLGHIFDDGPREKTGKRYCINSASLKFVPAKDALK